MTGAGIVWGFKQGRGDTCAGIVGLGIVGLGGFVVGLWSRSSGTPTPSGISKSDPLSSLGTEWESCSLQQSCRVDQLIAWGNLRLRTGHWKPGRLWYTIQ